MGDYEQVLFVECGRGGLLFAQEVRYSDPANRTVGCLTSLSTGAMAVPLWGRREMLGGNLGGGEACLCVCLDKATRRLVG